METISKYLKEYFGVVAKISPLSINELTQLPLYLRGNYALYNGSIIDRNIIWAKVKSDGSYTPDQINKQGKQLKQFLGLPIVFVFDKIESWERKRLIERRISFVQPFRQIYIPELFLQLTDSLRSSENKSELSSKYLTPPAQCVILYHLEMASLEKIPFQEIAKMVHYSTMTVSRIIKELHHFKLVAIEGGKEKSIRFSAQGKDLWDSILPILSSPVREVWFTDQIRNDNHFRIGGDTALSNFTMLSESNRKTYVIGKNEFRSLKKSGALKSLDKKYGDNRIEVWLYNPAILSENKNVDKLSLYLSLKHEEDERVKGALEDLINEIQW
jgi:DNA-binding MarR family transcriptional regulator